MKIFQAYLQPRWDSRPRVIQSRPIGPPCTTLSRVEQHVMDYISTQNQCRWERGEKDSALDEYTDYPLAGTDLQDQVISSWLGRDENSESLDLHIYILATDLDEVNPTQDQNDPTAELSLLGSLS